MQLDFDAQSVIALRMMRLASGGAKTKTEMSRMVIEKALQPQRSWLGEKITWSPAKHLTYSENA